MIRRCAALWIPDDANASDVRQHVSEQFQPLRIEPRRYRGDASDVSARVRKASDESGLYRIVRGTGHDRDRSSQIVNCANHGADGYDDVDAARDEFRS